MSQETLNPELNGLQSSTAKASTPTEQKEESAKSLLSPEILDVLGQLANESLENLWGNLELRSRVELAKVFVKHTAGGVEFDKTAFESVWKLLTETDAN